MCSVVSLQLKYCYVMYTSNVTIQNLKYYVSLKSDSVPKMVWQAHHFDYFDL